MGLIVKGLIDSVIGVSGTPNPLYAGWNETEARAIDITSSPIDFTKSGWMIARVTPTSLAASNSYFLDVNSGSSNNACGLRFDSNDNINNRYRGEAGGSPNSMRLDDAFGYVNQTVTVALLWSGNTVVQCLAQGYTETTTMNDYPEGANTINILSRNGGVDIFSGTMHYWEVGNEAISMEQLQERMSKAGSNLVIGSGGQSLMENHFTAASDGEPYGYLEFIEKLTSYIPFDVQWINGADGGSALSARTGTPYWLDDENNNSFGESFNQFFANNNAIGAPLGIVTWAQGEAESHKINRVDEITSAEYKKLLVDAFKIMRARYPDCLIIIQKIGRRSDSFSNEGGIQAIAEIQQELIDDDAYPWILGGIETFDLELLDETGATDGVHLSDASEPLACDRLARYIANINEAGLTGVNGMKVTGASRSSTTVTVTVEHDGGTDFTPTTGIEGFVFFDDSSEIAINSAVRTNATTITLTLASTPSGVETLYYAYDEVAVTDYTNLVKDNATVSMPLRRAKIVL